MDLLRLLAPYFARYITIHRVVPNRTYDYAKRGSFRLPVVEAELHRPKVSVGEWLYIAIPAVADLAQLSDGDRLYVGSQAKADRMFRGDRLQGENFHHKEMRAGNDNRNLITHLMGAGEVVIHLLGRPQLAQAINEVSALAWLRPLLDSPADTRIHTGTRFESAILHYERDRWAWNRKGAEPRVVAMLKELELRRLTPPQLASATSDSMESSR